MTKTALITGITGQDGAYLAKSLLSKGYQVYGTHRHKSLTTFWRLEYLGIVDKVKLKPQATDYLTDTASLVKTIEACQPEEIYHLAAESSVATSFQDPITVGNIDGLGVARLLEAIKQVNPNIKYYEASSSEMYGKVNTRLRDETTPFQPVSPYAIARLYGYWMTQLYRDAYGIFACNGILFNHESHLRGLGFVTRKICNTAARIALGLENELSLGNLDIERDWGYAPEYVEAMWLMLQQEKPDDYVIATNEMHSLRQFTSKAFQTVGLDWQEYVRTDENLYRPLEVLSGQGNNSKAKHKLGWEPKVTFAAMIKMMVEEDMKRWQRWQRGEIFPWDVTNST